MIGGPTLLKFVSTFREVGCNLLGQLGGGELVGAGVVPAPVARALLPCLLVTCTWHPESGSSLYPRCS